MNRKSPGIQNVRKLFVNSCAFAFVIPGMFVIFSARCLRDTKLGWVIIGKNTQNHRNVILALQYECDFSYTRATASFDRDGLSVCSKSVLGEVW